VGFCLGKSTIQALLTATNDWLEMMESGIEAGAVFFDFTKAFNSVPHKALIEKTASHWPGCLPCAMDY